MLDVRQHYDSDLTDLLLTDLNLSASETFNHRSLDPHERAGSIYSSLCSWNAGFKWAPLQQCSCLETSRRL